MARKKRRGVTLFELLRKDQGQPVGPITRQQPGTPQQQAQLAEPLAPAATAVAPQPACSSQVIVDEKVTAADPSTPLRLQVEEDGYVLHLNRRTTILISAGAVIILVVFLLIGGVMFRAEKSVPGGQAAQAAANGEQVEPLASLAPPAGSENVTPDSPVRLSRSTKDVDMAEPEQDNTAPAKPMAAARTTPDREPSSGSREGRRTANAETSPQVASGQGDTRKPGLNYLVIQIIPADAKPSPHEHAAEVRKFLASKGIRTISVAAAGGGIKILSEQGFDSAEPADKHKCQQLIDEVRQAGKEYASARYMGRYNFASPYRELYKK